MALFKKILVATDYSDASQGALRAASLLARHLGATLKVLHVFEESAYAYPLPARSGAREQARGQLLQLVEDLRAKGLTADAVFEEGFAADQICAAATATGADLVAIGSHGRSGLPRWVHGSVAERVARLSRIPVLTVHPSDRLPDETTGGMFSRILAPTDFGSASRKGADLALEVARAFGGSLTLIHVCELPSQPYVTASDERDAEAHAQRELSRALSDVHSRLPKAEGTLRRGNPWAEIVHAVEQGASDLVVMSTHGRRGVAHAFLGSVAEKVIRLAPAMVLTVPAA